MGERALLLRGCGASYDLSGPSPVTRYVDTAAQTSYGPRWTGIQNISSLIPQLSLRYETDPVALTSVTVLTSTQQALVGDSIQVNLTATGGIGPFEGLFLLNGSSLGGKVTGITYRFLGTGSFSFAVYAVDSTDAVFGPSAPSVVYVPSILTIWSLTANPGAHGADVGQSVTFLANVSGGVGARTFGWSGLPSETARR